MLSIFRRFNLSPDKEYPSSAVFKRRKEPSRINQVLLVELLGFGTALNRGHSAATLGLCSDQWLSAYAFSNAFCGTKAAWSSPLYEKAMNGAVAAGSTQNDSLVRP